MRAPIRTSLAVLAAGAVALSGLLAAPATAMGAPAQGPRVRSVITLITGDRVVASPGPSGSQPHFSVLPAHPTGAAAGFHTMHAAGSTYVIPVVAERYLGTRLDPSLFDVSALATGSRLQVRVSHTGGRPTLPGVTLTSDAGGVASGYLTASSSRTFGDALLTQWRADAAAKSGSTSGLFAHVSRIAAASAAPGPVTPDFPMLTLRILVTGLDGRPEASGFASLMNVDDGRKFIGFVPVVRGEARVSVPAGHYAAVFDAFDFPADSTGTVAVVPVASYLVSGPGQTLSVDMRSATVPVRVVTPKPVASGVLGFTYARGDGKSSEFGSGYFVDYGTALLVAPVAAPGTGTQSVETSSELLAPGARPAYTFDTATQAESVGTSLTTTVALARSAVVHAQYDTDAPGRVGGFGRAAAFADDFFIFTLLQPLALPDQRTEYVQSSGSPLWYDSFLSNFNADDPGFIDAGPYRYPAGQSVQHTFGKGPLGPHVPTPADNPAPFCWTCRQGSYLTLALPGFTDSQPDHIGEIFGSPDGSPVTHLRLTADGKTLVEGDDLLGARIAVPAAAATYVESVDVDREWTDTTKSTRSSTTLSFHSAAGQGAVAPHGWFCDGTQGATCRVLPVLQARADLPVDSTNTMATGTRTFTVVAGRVPGATPAAVTGATLSIRPAGFGWVDVPLHASGPATQGRFSGTLAIPSFIAGRDVDVRVTARDAGGSTWDQTVVRASSFVAGSGSASASAGASSVWRTTPAAASEVNGLHRSCARAAAGSLGCLSVWRRGAGRGTGARIAAGARTSAAGAPQDGYGPADIRSAYQLDQSRGAGQTIAVVDAYDNPNAESDLAAYRKAWGLSPCTSANGCFRKVNQDGGSTLPPPDAGWGVEIALDVQAVSAACPKCRILLVEAKNPSYANLGRSVNRAVAMGAGVVSNSYGGPEFHGITARGRNFFTHPGTAIVASSGDGGFGPAQFPASWQSVIAVGGTSLTKAATGSAWSERAWDYAGSGCSAWIPKPVWQHDTHCSMRTVADVSAVADPQTGFAVYDTYGLGADSGWIVVGGTSLSAPLVSAMIGLAGNAHQMDSAQPIYAHPSGLHDVVGGANGYCGRDYLCTAKPGYDAPTGVGSPRGLGAL